MVAATVVVEPLPMYWFTYMYDELTYDVVYWMPIPSRIGVAVVVPLRVALQSKLVLAEAKLTVCPELTFRHVAPPSLDRSTSMLVPDGM